MKTFRLVILTSSIGIFASCGKDEEPDFVGDSVGDYAYSVTISKTGNNVSYTSGDLTLTRNGDEFTIIVDDIESFKSSDLELNSKGYRFTIADATLTDDDGDLVLRRGSYTSTVNGKFCHGHYDSDAKQLFITASYTYQDPRYSSYNFIAEVKATKK